jgi:hypothetical protein
VDLSSATLRGSVPLSVPARAALVSLDEVERTLARATAPGWALQQAVLDAADPREAAAIAAWQALSGRLDAGERRHFTHFSGRIDEKAAEPVSFERALSAVARRWQRPSMEQRTRVERGQGRLWMLLASPCGTSGESSADAGVSALLMRTLASTRARLGQVAIEPWASTDGIGLLAHASPLGPRESSIAHAERVADALGRAVFSRLGDADVAAARAELLRDLGSKPRAGFAALLEGLAPGHPSWLEPRGSWEAVSELTPQGVAARRQLFWRGPLRVAIVSNADKAQSAAAAAALDRWFRPLRGEPSGCPQDSAAIPQSGQMSVATTGGSEASVVYVAVPIPADAGSRAAGRATAYLLNRRGGWLDRALGGPKLASSARASVFGGSRAGALVIEVRAVEGKTSDAAAQVRALLKRLSEGAATVEDAARAAEWLARVEQAAVLDPRRRIVELWTGAAEAPPPSVKELRQLHRGFGAEAHLVVQVEAK